MPNRQLRHELLSYLLPMIERKITLHRMPNRQLRHFEDGYASNNRCAITLHRMPNRQLREKRKMKNGGAKNEKTFNTSLSFASVM